MHHDDGARRPGHNISYPAPRGIHDAAQAPRDAIASQEPHLAPHFLSTLKTFAYGGSLTGLIPFLPSTAPSDDLLPRTRRLEWVSLGKWDFPLNAGGKAGPVAIHTIARSRRMPEAPEAACLRGLPQAPTACQKLVIRLCGGIASIDRRNPLVP
jgi:uncharacterized membrane protein